MRALIQRINRKLVSDDRVLKKTRGARARMDFGDFYILNFNRNWITNHHVDPEEWGRKLEVLAPWEKVEEEG